MKCKERLTAIGIALNSVLLLMSVSAGAFAASDAAAVSSQVAPMPRPIRELQELDEVRVRGEATANILIDAENVFFSLYNLLEKDDSYRITCGEARLNPDSVVRTRTCAPGFFSLYVPSPPPFISTPCDGGYFDSDQTGYSPPGGCGDAGYEPPSMEFILMARGEKWRKHMTRTINSDPRLSALARHLGDLQHQLAELQTRYVQIKREKRAAARAAKGPVVRNSTGPRTL